MSMLSEKQERFVEAAKTVYEEQLRDRLERKHFGEVIAVEPESGDYALGETLDEADRVCRERFGVKPVHVFRVGGGGAMKVGGAWRGRVS